MYCSDAVDYITQHDRLAVGTNTCSKQNTHSRSQGSHISRYSHPISLSSAVFPWLLFVFIIDIFSQFVSKSGTAMVDGVLIVDFMSAVLEHKGLLEEVNTTLTQSQHCLLTRSQSASSAL